mmetsp:Transcript_67303/g.106071  ORF Transcript_67303/g.106071 Transcript_67303/m.106071 type:complete len:220 (+) Transcript_67303:1309-1968(+)
MISAHHRSRLQEEIQVVVIGHHPHGGAAQHVGGTHQHWVACGLAEPPGFFQGGKLRPFGLVHPQGVAQLAELVAVLTRVDGFHRGSQDSDAAPVEAQGQVVRRLTSNRDHHTPGVFQLADVHDPLVAQFLEVQAIGFVKVGGHSLRVAVDHNGLVPHRAQRPDATYAAPVELHAASNPIRATAQNDDARFALFGVRALSLELQRQRLRNGRCQVSDFDI